MTKRRVLYACLLTGMASAAIPAIWSGSVSAQVSAQNSQQLAPATDPGPRSGAPGAGGQLPGLTTGQAAFFATGKEDFQEAEGIGDGLGPRFNLDSCGGCHAHPATGGSSPPTNPQVGLATAFGARNVAPSFVRPNGPIREARFKRNPDGSPDGGVHALYVISGRVDSTGNATGCNAAQEDFERQVANRNIIFRIPTPVFGAGLIEQIKDSTLVANLAAFPAAKAVLGISGRLNHNGNDGTVSRFGWKAQNQSLMIFSGEAYNVEMGISNDLFQSERDQNTTCQFASVPNDSQLFDNTAGFPALITAVENFANFQRFLDQPTPVPSFPGASASSVANGRAVFSAIGCGLCHTPSLQTSDVAVVTALRNKTANLYSDIALHNMGPGLADDIAQGGASGDEFRTAPLWGLGQRVFFLHDGRTSDLVQAIHEHRSERNGTYRASEANEVVNNFDRLGNAAKKDLLNFLRSL